MGVKGKIVEIPLDRLVDSECNVRRGVAFECRRKMADSIRKRGVIHPITVRPRGDKFEVIVGRTRVEGAKLAGLKSILARVVETNDRDVHRPLFP